MKINMKAPLAAAALGFGLFTVAHAAQPATQTAKQSPMAQMPMMQGEHPMMNDQQMRGEMSAMKQGCRKMMERMSNMSSPAPRTR